MEQFGPHRTDFHKIDNLRIFLKSVDKIQLRLKSGKKNGTLHEDVCIFMIISRRILLKIRNASDESRKQNQNSHFMYNNFFPWKSCRLWHNVEKYGTARQATDDNIIRRMRFACCTTKATDIQYGTFIAFPRQPRLRERPWILRYTYIACLVHPPVTSSHRSHRWYTNIINDRTLNPSQMRWPLMARNMCQARWESIP
jgi:hypothetical protein